MGVDISVEAEIITVITFYITGREEGKGMVRGVGWEERRRREDREEGHTKARRGMLVVLDNSTTMGVMTAAEEALVKKAVNKEVAI